MSDNKRMGSTAVDTSTLGVRFADGTYQTTAAASLSQFGNVVTSDATGITITDAFGNLFQMTDGYAFLSLASSGGGLSVFYDGTTYGAAVSDGNGNALLLGDGFGNFNLSNKSGHAGIISASGDTCYVYGSPLYVGVAGGFAGLNITTSGVSIVGSVFSIPSNVPATASSTGIAGQIAWDSTRLYLCVAPNTWLRSAVMTTW
jgi:hypothetical protein